MPHDTGRSVAARGALLAAVVLMAACGSDSNDNDNNNQTGRTIYAVDLSNNLAMFHSATPGSVDFKIAITGLPEDHRIVGIDFRTADGKLYGVGTDSRVYTIDTITAAATPVGAAFTPAINGEHFGMALDEITDRIRLQSAESGQNLRIDPTTGQVASTDPVLTYASGDGNESETPAIAATAVTGESETMYGVDWELGVLVTGTANTGVVTTLGDIGVSTGPCAALDLASDGTLFASLVPSSDNVLYTVSRTDGTATEIGPIDVFASIQSIAVAPGGASGSRVSGRNAPTASIAPKPRSSASSRASAARVSSAVDHGASGSFICRTDPE